MTSLAAVVMLTMPLCMPFCLQPVEPLAYSAPSYSPPRPAPTEGDGPLFAHIPRRRRTESFMKSSSKAGGTADMSTASPSAQQVCSARQGVRRCTPASELEALSLAVACSAAIKSFAFVFRCWHPVLLAQQTQVTHTSYLLY